MFRNSNELFEQHHRLFFVIATSFLVLHNRVVLHNILKKEERARKYASMGKKSFHSITMRRENKYGTNKTIRLCHYALGKYSYLHFPEQPCVNKRSCWKVMDLLKEHAQSPNYSNKIVLRRTYNFYQYNGYNNVLRENPPKHLSFARRPDFVYQPDVHFIKVNQEVFDLALHDGWKIFQNEINVEHLLDINSLDISVTLIYFLDDSKHCSSSNWSHAQRHAFGGYFADYNTVCLGDYCPFGPKLRGIQSSDPRINQVLFITRQSKRLERCINCSCRSSKCSRGSEYKTGRSQVKIQRQEKYKLTKQAKAAQLLN